MHGVRDVGWRADSGGVLDDEDFRAKIESHDGTVGDREIPDSSSGDRSADGFTGRLIDTRITACGSPILLVPGDIGRNPESLSVLSGMYPIKKSSRWHQGNRHFSMSLHFSIESIRVARLDGDEGVIDTRIRAFGSPPENHKYPLDSNS